MSEQIPQPPAATPRTRSKQNQKLANDIALVGQMIDVGLADAEAAPHLLEGGFTPAEFARIKQIQTDTQQAFYDQLQAIADQTAASQTYRLAEKALHKYFVLLRGYARNAFPDNPAAQEALGVGGDIPADLQKLITAAGNLAEKGVKAEYTAQLSTKTVTKLRLAELQQKIDALVAADAAQNAAITAKPQATARLTTLTAQLFDWASNYRGFVNLRFKELERSDIAKRLLC